MQLSVIILNYNVRHFLEQCVLSVQAAIENIDGEIIVVDNHSSDDSCEMMKQRFPHIKLIENPTNAGFPKGNNLGVAQAKGEYLCILNPDTVVAEDTFTKILAFAQSKPNLGIVGCKLIDGTGHFLPESKRGIPTPWVAFTKVIGLYKLSDAFGKYYASHLGQNQTGKVEILVGAFMLMKTQTYREVGGFDEDCFMYSDDIDLSYMVLKTGKTNYYFHEASVIHYKGESTVRDGLYMKRFREAMDFFYKKHFRKSVFFDLSMKIGATLFSVAKQKQAVKKTVKPNKYLLLSDDEQLRQDVENLLGKKVIRHGTDLKNTINSLTSRSYSNTELIFDNATLHFKQIITLMEQLKDSGLTFKILPHDTGFLIGSNDSNDRGEVIKISE